MTEERLRELLDKFSSARILVVGDFFLDQYLVLESALTEVSLETGKDAYQVVGKRLSPGAAGTVTSNLHALEAGELLALGVLGVDGEGFALRHGLQALGVVTEQLIENPELFTPTYTKPMLRTADGEEELQRFDIKNRHPLPLAVEQQVIERLRQLLPAVDATIVADQVTERNCGVITDAVRAELAVLARQYPEKIIIADSRRHIGEFRHLWIKPNQHEVAAALGVEETGTTLSALAEVGQALCARNGRPVFITLAERGILAVSSDAANHVPTLRQRGPIDICGAGDSTMAGMTLALCAGARPEEAAVIGNLVASLTVQQIGVTGTATRAQVLARFQESGEEFRVESVEWRVS